MICETAEELDKSLALRFKGIRKRKGITQAQLAEKSNVSYGSIKRFETLSDTGRTVIEAYDAWKEKKNYGKVSMGVVRTTYLIDEDGVIVFANDKAKAAEDAENMLK